MVRSVFVVIIVSVSLALAGCAAQTNSVDDWDPSSATSALLHAKKMGYKEAAIVLADGEVTKEEWKSLHMGWVACMTKLGFQFEPPLLDPINGREYVENRVYRGPNSSPSGDDLDRCDARFDFSVGQIYYNQTPASMDPALVAAVHACLDDKGVKYGGNEVKYEDFFAAKDKNLGGAATGPVADCANASMRELYPTMQSWGLGF